MAGKDSLGVSRAELLLSCWDGFGCGINPPDDWPEYTLKWQYWVVTLLMILAGGLLVIAYLRSQVMVNPIMAINIGASAPLLIGALVSQAPPIPAGRIG